MLIHSQIVEFKMEGTSTFGYLAHPKGEGSYPGVVVLPEWWGIDTHIQQLTERLAEAGFAVIAPDLYRGQVATTVEEAQKLSQQLDQASALQEIQEAITYLATNPHVTPHKVGILGFGMGGSLGAILATSQPNLGALVIFYGGRGDPTNSNHEQAIAATTAPFMGIYGGADEKIPLDYINWLKEKLAALGKEHEIIVYPLADRSFFNDTRSNYRADDAADAWQHTLSWFQQHLLVPKQ